MLDLRIGGIVLCGGQSKRMGTPKAWLPFGDQTMLQRIVGLLREVVSHVVVVKSADQELPPLPSEIMQVCDELPGRGPLQGMKSGLLALQGKVDAAYLSSCDVPMLKPAFVLRLGQLLREHLICVPRVGEYFHPLAALYRLEVLPAVTQLLAEDRLKTARLLERVPTRVVTEDELRDVDPTFESLRNLNTHDEYAAACDASSQGTAL